MKKHFKLALEEAIPVQDTKPQREDEVVMYGRITDFYGLDKADKVERHEQWQIKTKIGQVRVRKTEPVGADAGKDVFYDLTFKVKDNSLGINGGSETTYQIDEEQFESFKMLAEQGMVKVRHCFKVSSLSIKLEDGTDKDIEVPDMYYEVDVFSKESYPRIPYAWCKEWCKVDLEVNPLMEVLRTKHPDIKMVSLNIKASALPIGLVDVMLQDSDDKTVKDKITALYDSEFLTVNPRLKKD